MTADTDTNTPRDGLTDADIARIINTRGAMSSPAMVAMVRDAIEADHRIRAADREARPVPAALEAAFRAAWKQEVGGGANHAGREVALRVMLSALAASTPPAEPWLRPNVPARVDGHEVAVVLRHGATVRLEWASVEAAHNAKPGPLFTAAARVAPDEVVDLLTEIRDGNASLVLSNDILAQIDAVTRNARHASEARATPTPQQVSDYLNGLDAIQRGVVEREARATGDASRLADTVLAWWEKHQHDTTGERGEFNVYDDEPEFVALARAALSDRSTGAVPAGPKPCSVGVNGGRKEVILAFHTTADALAWSDAMIGSASAPAAPPVAPGAKAKFFSDAIDRFDAQATAKGYEDIHSALDAAPDRAATGAAGEPQPREGWKWVPVEPTTEMLIDGSYERTEGDGEIADIYRAMLAAAPSAQADSGAAGGQGDKP